MKITIEDFHGGQCDCGRGEVGFVVKTLINVCEEDVVVLTLFTCPDCVADIGKTAIDALR